MRRTLFTSAVALVGVVALVVIGAAGGAQAKKPALSATPVFKLHLKPSQEAPEPVKGLKADAVGSVTFDLERSSAGIISGEVIFYFNYSFPGSVTINGLHVHQGAKGAAGGIVISSNVATFTDADGKGNITAVVTGTSSTLLQEILANPRGYYVNLHTSVNPAGAIRDQMHNPKKR